MWLNWSLGVGMRSGLKWIIFTFFTVFVILTGYYASTLVSEYPQTIPTKSPANRIVVAGNYAYLACGDGGLEIFNLTNPGSPGLSWNLPIEGYANDMAVEGDYAYIAAGNSGLAVEDISNPANLLPPQYLMLNGPVSRLTVAGNYTYVIAGGHVSICNITDPSNPSVVNETTGIVASAVAVNGTYMYAIDQTKFMIYNVGDPTNVLMIVNKTLANAFSNIYLNNYCIYLTNNGSRGGQIYLANPTSISYNGIYYGYTANALAFYQSWMFSVDITGITAYNLTSIQEVSFPPYDAPGNDIAVTGSRIYVINTNGLEIANVDMSNLDQIPTNYSNLIFYIELFSTLSFISLILFIVAFIRAKRTNKIEQYKSQVKKFSEYGWRR